MKKNIVRLVILFALSCLSSCTAIEGIFKAGAIVGVVGVIVVIGIIVWIASKFRNKN
jgi:hypothetical protein